MTVTTSSAGRLDSMDADALKRQHDRHSRLGLTRHCAACNAYWPCAYRTSATNKLRAAGVLVGVL